MNNKPYRLSDSLANIYDEVRAEVGFSLSLSNLLRDTNVWKTEIASSLRQAHRHLLRARSYEINATECTGQMLLAELYIRDLVEHLNDELAEYSTQIMPFERMQPERLSVAYPQHDTFESKIYNSADHKIEDHYCRFTRIGNDIEVIVDHLSETNFFADISYDLQSGGLFVATYNILDVGTRLNVRLVLPGRHSFQLKGTVSWVREPDNCADDVSPGMGITFGKLSHEPIRAIRQFMSERPPLLFEVA